MSDFRAKSLEGEKRQLESVKKCAVENEMKQHGD